MIPSVPTISPLTIFTVLTDDREKAPYTFAGIELAIPKDGIDLSRDHNGERRRYAVRCASCRLLSGDYSLPGRTDKVTVTRKSLEDLYATLANRNSRRRFEAELERMALLESACVVVEADYQRANPPHRSTLPRRALLDRIDAYRSWHPSIIWASTPLGRRGGEIITFLFLVAAATDRE
jgi:hypothetical protein